MGTREDVINVINLIKVIGGIVVIAITVPTSPV
jgi:hypothetical protein